MLQHGTCAAWNGRGVLLIGESGAGKSDLLLRLIDRRGWLLVADDQVRLSLEGTCLSAEAPETLSGMLEVRGIGLMTGLKAAPSVLLSLVVACVDRGLVPRLPPRRTWCRLGVSVPMVALHVLEASAPRKVEIAVLSADGRLDCLAGAFSPA